MFGRARQLRRLKEGVAKLSAEGLDAEGREIANIVLTQLSLACEMLSKGVETPAPAADLYKRIDTTKNEAFLKLRLLNAMNTFSFYMARVQNDATMRRARSLRVRRGN